MTDPTPTSPPDGDRRIGEPEAREHTNQTRGTIGDRPREEEPDPHAEAIAALRSDPALRPNDAAAGEGAPTEEDAQLRVRWVRPTDLAAQAGARVVEQGVQLNQRSIDLARHAALEAARDARGRLRQALARRERSLTPDTPTTASVPALGRQGVSR